MDILTYVLLILVIVLIFSLAYLKLNMAITKKELKKNEIHLNTVIESQPECVKLHDRNGIVLEMNQAGIDLLEADRIESVIGKSVYDFIDMEYHGEYKKLTDNVFSGQRQIMEFKMHGRRGTDRWLETNAVPLYDQSKNIIAVLAITRDVSLRKKLESKLQKRQMELAHVCRVNTMGEVASGIAHELNQPLCAISSYAETSITHLTNRNYTELRETMQLISEQSERASHIVTWIRELASKKETNFTEVKITELLTDIKMISEWFMKENKTVLNINVENYLPCVYGDRIQLEQALINLIKNSVESMSECLREKVVSIDAKYDEYTKRVHISVIDNGTGIPIDQKSKVLDPYFTTKKKGLGMGLSICRSIINAHNGRIWIERSDENGTVFTFSLETKEVKSCQNQYA